MIVRGGPVLNIQNQDRKLHNLPAQSTPPINTAVLTNPRSGATQWNWLSWLSPAAAHPDDGQGNGAAGWVGAVLSCDANPECYE